MNKKVASLVVPVVIVVIAVGVYAHNHKSNTNATSNYSSTSSTSTKTQSSSSAKVNNAVVITKTDASLGEYLADSSGNSLYTYSSDSKGVSNCTGSCLSAWPPYQDKGATTGLPTNVGIIKRTDNGQAQYTYKGLPLYLFTSDSPGQVTGNGVSGFVVARP